MLQKKIKNQASKSGSFLLKNVCLFISLFLVGSCNEQAKIFNFPNDRVELSNINKGDLVRYSYAMQASMVQNPELITKFTADEIILALSKPDLERVDGNKSVWQYRTSSCVLDVFMNKNNQVKDYEFRARRNISDDLASQEKNQKTVTDWQCLQGVIQERRRAIESGFSETYAVLSLKTHKS